MSQTVIGMFDDASQARQAAMQLENSGLSRDNIDITAQSGATGAASGSASSNNDDDSIGGFFRSLFNSDDEVTKYSEVARRGSMVTVHAQTPQQAEKARDILDRFGAVDVDERAQQYNSGWTGMSANQNQNLGASQNMDASASLGTTAGLGTESTTNQNITGRGADVTDQSINIIEEQMQVGKREVETGGARLRSRIIEKPVEEHLRLRQEHVWIERNPVNRPASEADIQGFREGEVEITEKAEVPIVNKEARVVEEIRLGKEVEERDETVRGTVRKTEVDVERLGGDANRQSGMSSDQTNPNLGAGL